MDDVSIGKTKSKTGRPKSALDLPEGWQNTIIELYRVGASDTEIKAWIIENRESGTLSVNLWDRWLEEEPAFSEVILRGRALAQAWWEKEGRTNLKAQHFQPGLYTLNMANRYGWNSNKTDVKLDAGEQLTQFVSRVLQAGDGQTRGIPEKK